MIVTLMNLLRACWRPSSNRTGSDATGRQDGLLWYKDTGQHVNGDYSMAVVQANNLLEDQCQIESGPLSFLDSGPYGTFVGVYDGHGGPETACYINDNLFNHLKRFVSEQNSMSADVLRKAYEATEDGFFSIVTKQWPVKPQIAAVGSCCLVGVICGGILYIANVGDSRAVLGKHVKATGEVLAVQLSAEHNVSTESVRKELQSAHPEDRHVVVLKHNVWRVKGLIQVFYKVPTEDSTKAGQVLVNAARKMVRQQRYDARIVAISHFYAEQGKRVLKKEIVEKGLTLSKEEFMGIAPKWVDGRDDGWAALVDLWVGEDAEFMAQSMKNRENRGKDGTHNAGNRSHDRYKAHQEQVHGKPLTKLGAWKMSHKKTKVDKPGEEQYYGKSGTYLQNYATAFKKLHGEDSQPLEEEVDETVVIVSGLGKRHGRHQILDGVIAPTTTLTQVRASSMSSIQLIPPRPRPGGSRQAFDTSLDEAYNRLYESYEEKLEEYVKSVEAHDAYQASHNAAVMAYITTGVQPTMGSPPPPKPPLPRIPTREEFLASVASGIPGSAQSSTDFGRASASPSPSPSQSRPITPIHTGSSRGPSASAEPADLPFQ